MREARGRINGGGLRGGEKGAFCHHTELGPWEEDGECEGEE